MKIGYDCDGVITIGIVPRKDGIIITGRSYEEEIETKAYLNSLGITNEIHFNPIPFSSKTRKSSGQWKAAKIKELGITRFIEDDEIQITEILAINPDIEIVHVISNLTEKENVRRDEHGIEIQLK